MRYEFDRDQTKAKSNLAKHGISFEEAIAVFYDPLALSRLDEDYGANEERWVTRGQAREGRMGLVVHTYVEVAEDRVAIRIISARRPTNREMRQYEQGNCA